MKCPVCSNCEIEKVDRLYDDRYGYPGYFNLFKCSECSHIFLDCSLSSKQLTELYTNYYPRKTFDLNSFQPYKEETGFLAWFNGLSSSAFRWIPENVSILDIGCGFGESLGYHTARGCDVYGVEADENIRRVVDKYGYKVHVGLFDEHNYEQDYFDYITMDQVIEHVTDPLAVLDGMKRLLKPGGKIVLSTPNAQGWGGRLFGKKWINWHTPYHIQFFSRKSIRIAADKCGLKVLKIKTVTNSEWVNYQWHHLLTFPEQGKTSWFWSPDKNGSVAPSILMMRLIALVHRFKVNHLLTRFFDALSLGDNFIFILTRK